METISITSRGDRRTYQARFEEVRSAERLHLGWATVTATDCTLRFPAVVAMNETRQGYTVYTVSDWQAPESSFGDLSDPVDWAILVRTGTGHFVNPRLENASPINVSALALPMTDEQKREFNVQVKR